MKVRKQGISWLLCLAMLLSLTNLSAIPASAAATSMPAGETRNGITYIKLTEDVQLSSHWVVEKNIDLDLNGHDIYRSLSKGSNVGEVINVNNKNITLSIRDTSSDDVSKQGRIGAAAATQAEESWSMRVPLICTPEGLPIIQQIPTIKYPETAAPSILRMRMIPNSTCMGAKSAITPQQVVVVPSMRLALQRSPAVRLSITAVI